MKKRLKHKYGPRLEFPPVFANGGDLNLVGDMGNTGYQDQNFNKNRIVLNSGEKVLAGIAGGLSSAIGLGGLTSAMYDRWGVSDQLSKDKGFQTASGISGGLGSLGMTVAGMAGGFKGGNNTQGLSTPSKPALYPDGGAMSAIGQVNTNPDRRLLSEQEKNSWNNYLSWVRSNKLGLNPTDRYDYHNYTDYDTGTNYNDSWINEYNKLNPSNQVPLDITKNAQYTYMRDQELNPGLYASPYVNKNTEGEPIHSPSEGWLGSLTMNQFFPKRRLVDTMNNKNTILNQTDTLGVNSENPMLSLKDLPMGFGRKAAPSFAYGGNMGLNEINNGGTHESSPLNGVPIADKALVEEDETIYEPENYVFSDRIKVPDKNKTFAQESKRIKSKFKLRPYDKLSKEAMDAEIGNLMALQEEIKQTKAMSHMNKAMQMMYGGNMKSCNCGGEMGLGGALPEYKSGGWIQSATASIKRRGTKGVCTGSKFGSSSCLPGSKRYNLAKTFKKMAKNRKKANGGYMYPDGGPISDPVTPVLYPNDAIGLLDGNMITRKPQPLVNFTPSTGYNPITPRVPNPYNPVLDNSGANPVNPTYLTDNNLVLDSSTLPTDYTGLNAGLYGALGTANALAGMLTPGARTVGNKYFKTVNTYPQQVIAQEQANNAMAGLKSAYRNTGLNPGQYLSAVTMGLGDIQTNAGKNIAEIKNKGDLINTEINNQQTQFNTGLERERNLLRDQSDANRVQMGLEGLGQIVSGTSGALRDKSARDMEMFTLPYLGTQNYGYRYNTKTKKLERIFKPTVTDLNLEEEKPVKKFGGRVKLK